MPKNILIIDIGNTNIVFGLFSDGELKFTERIKTEVKRTADNFIITLVEIFSMNNINVSDIDGSVISSVVPDVVDAVISAIFSLTMKKPIIANVSSAKIKMDVEGEALVGTDRISNAVAAIKKYPLPIIIFDLGTATTVSVIDSKGTFIGGCIIPGVMTSLDALTNKAAQLPHIDISSPGPMIAKNTIDCMLSGIVYGTAAMIDGIIERTETELGAVASVVATGGLAEGIIPYCKKSVVQDPNLIIEGLYQIYMDNYNFEQ